MKVSEWLMEDSQEIWRVKSMEKKTAHKSCS